MRFCASAKHKHFSTKLPKHGFVTIYFSTREGKLSVYLSLRPLGHYLMTRWEFIPRCTGIRPLDKASWNGVLTPNHPPERIKSGRTRSGRTGSGRIFLFYFCIKGLYLHLNLKESIHCTQATKHASEGSTLALKPRGDVTRSPKQGHPPKFF